MANCQAVTKKGKGPQCTNGDASPDADSGLWLCHLPKRLLVDAIASEICAFFGGEVEVSGALFAYQAREIAADGVERALISARRASARTKRASGSR